MHDLRRAGTLIADSLFVLSDMSAEGFDSSGLVGGALVFI
jgi:hypothetical protein